jgi:hypothetical protein
MEDKNTKKSRKKLSKEERMVDIMERVGVGLLYASTELGQNSIAQILGMSDGRVNEMLRGIKKPGKRN